jgi:hypothetical protein
MEPQCLRQKTERQLAGFSQIPFCDVSSYGLALGPEPGDVVSRACLAPIALRLDLLLGNFVNRCRRATTRQQMTASQLRLYGPEVAACEADHVYAIIVMAAVTDL